MNGKQIVIREVNLTDEQLEERCRTCSLNSYGQCLSSVKSFLVNSHGFRLCELGYNYEVEDLENDYVLDTLDKPKNLEEALRVIESLKSINSVQSFAIRQQRNLLRESELVNA